MFITEQNTAVQTNKDLYSESPVCVSINDQNAVIQGLANVELESLKLSEEVTGLVERVLNEGSVNSSDILKSLRG